MTSDSWHADENSALRGGPYPMVNIGSVMHEVSESVDAKEFTPLSVGNNGVTAQLEGVAKPATTAGRKLLRKGQLAINSRSDRRGAAGVSDYTGSVSVVNTVIDFDDAKLNSKYLHYLIRSRAFQEEYYRFGTGIVDDLWSTRFSRMAQIRIPLPPLETQCRIAHYLDQETGQIDETITRIDNVVELLEERRARTHRDAFSDNYQTTSLMTVAEITLGKMLDQKNTVGEPTEYLRAANIRKDGTVDLEDTKRMLMTADERERYELRAGDILMVEGGDAGRVALLHDDLPGLAIQKTLMRIRVNKTIADPAYCYWWIDHLHKSGVLALDYSVSTIAHFTAEKAQRIRVPLPPLERQRKTAKCLQSQNAETNKMINQATRVKELLQERRSALITAAVTGKIEV